LSLLSTKLAAKEAELEEVSRDVQDAMRAAAEHSRDFGLDISADADGLGSSVSFVSTLAHGEAFDGDAFKAGLASRLGVEAASISLSEKISQKKMSREGKQVIATISFPEAGGAAEALPTIVSLQSSLPNFSEVVNSRVASSASPEVRVHEVPGANPERSALT
jgi:hypothetical protein